MQAIACNFIKKEALAQYFTINFTEFKNHLFLEYIRRLLLFASSLNTNRNVTGRNIIKSHKRTLRGRMLITMTNVNSIYWTPTLRKLIKSNIKKILWLSKEQCIFLYRSKIWSITNCENRNNHVLSSNIQVINFEGPIYYKTKARLKAKVYV